MTRDPRSLRLQTSAIVILAIGAMAVLALRLHKELNFRYEHLGDRKAVATLTSGIRSVQRKLSKEVLWESVATRDALYNKDTVRTSSDSAAVIQFDDGTRVELAENSLIVLDRSDDKIKIDFLKGAVFATSAGEGGSGVEISTSGGRIKVGDSNSKGALALTSGKSGLEVTVQEGSAELQTDQGSTQFAANERGNLNAAGVTKQKITLFSKMPVANARLLASDGTLPVPFSWTSVADSALESRLQVARDREFEQMIFSQPVPAGHKVSLGEGAYHWRVVTMDSGKIVDSSERRAFRVFRHPVVRLESPVVSADLAFFRSRPSPRFLWSRIGSTHARERIELATSPRFENPIAPVSLNRVAGTAGIERAEARFSSFVEGNYFWRVMSRYEGLGVDGKGVLEVPSETRGFRVMRTSKLPTPALLSPESGATLTLKEKSNHLNLQWRPILEAAAYRLRVAADPKMSAPIIDVTLATPQWEGDLKASGRLYWNVQALAASEAGSPGDSDSSPAFNFDLVRSGGFRVLAPLAEASDFEYIDQRPEIRFAWEKVGGGERYVLEVADDADFNGIDFARAVVATGTSPELKTSELPIGKRYWRVRALRSDGQTTAISQVGQYQLRERPLLVAPEKHLPASQALLRSENEISVPFAWKTVSAAKSYRLSLWRQSATGKLEAIASEEVQDTTRTRTVEPGIYQWDVRTIDSAGRIGPAGQTRVLQVRGAERLAAPTILSPMDAAALKDVRPRPVPLKWQMVSGAQAYELVVSRKQDDGVTKELLRKRVSDTEYVLPALLPAGDYQWEVTAIGAAPGIPNGKLGERSVSRFQLQWQGVLRAPAQIKVRMEEDR